MWTMRTVTPAGSGNRRSSCSFSASHRETNSSRTGTSAVRVAADVPPSERTDLEILRTDTPTFQALIESRRNRREEWFVQPAGRIEINNVPIPVRVKGALEP